MNGREWPYILEWDSIGAGLLYFGSYHTQNPDDNQLPIIEDQWAEFRPTVALTENRGGFVWGGRRKAVRSLGEFGRVISLAKDAKVPIYTLEPTWEDEVAMVTARFPPAEATIFYTLRVFLSERGSEQDLGKIDKLAAHLLRKRGSRPGLEGAVPDLAAMDELWTSSFGDERDWRNLPPEAIWPGREPTKLQDISRFVNEVRDRHMAKLILTFVNRGERVFAIAGGSHVVKQEPVLQAGWPSN